MSSSLADVLPALVDALVDEFSDADGDPDRQPSSPDLGRGLGGAAFALWRYGVIAGQPAAIESARRIVIALRAEVDEASVAGDDGVVYGRAGLDWLAGLLGLPATSVPLRTATSRVELVGGDAGRLLAAAHELSRGDPRAKDSGESVVAALVGARGTQSIAWADIGWIGMAHGVAGVHFALLEWAELTGGDLPGWFADSLDALLARAESPGRWPISLEPDFAPAFGWCNGAPGMAMLWVKAHERLPSARYREAARAAGEVTLASPSGAADFCCGAIGEAYALWMLARVDDSIDWRERALSRAAPGLGTPLPNLGLIKGEAGALCLAADLLLGHIRVPFLETPVTRA